MNPKDQAEYCEIICVSYSEQEIRIFENFAAHFFALVAEGKTVHLEDKLIVDYMRDIKKKKGGETNAGKDG